MKIEVIVKPGSKKGPLVVAAPFDVKVGQPSGLIVYLREKPHDGEANAALVRVLADYYDVAKSYVRVVTGQKSHRKVVEIVK